MPIERKMLDQLYFQKGKIETEMFKLSEKSDYSQNDCGDSHDRIRDRAQYITLKQCQGSINDLIDFYIGVF